MSAQLASPSYRRVRQQNKFITPIYIAAFLLVATIYLQVAVTSPGYDDEIYNISNIEKYGYGAFLITQTTDVHPPGSYIINAILYNALGDWSYVRASSAVFSILCLFYVIKKVHYRFGYVAAIIGMATMALNPAMLMWCTSIRWYSYFTPILAIACITPDNNNQYYWTRLLFFLLILSYIGYAALLVMPALYALYWTASTAPRPQKFYRATISLIAFFIIYSLQLQTLIQVHLKNKGPQISSGLKNITGFTIAQISNQGVFPLSAGGIISAVGASGLLILISIEYFFEKKKSIYFLPYFLTITAFILSGLSGKFRNWIVATPLQALCYATINLSNKRLIKLVLVGFITIGNVFGLSNVITHRDTTKSNWNTPFKESFIFIDHLKNKCYDSIILFAHDPIITHWAKVHNIQIISPYSQELNQSEISRKNFKCGAAVKTYSGSLDPALVKKMYGELDAISNNLTESVYLGQDKYYRYKRLVDQNFPEYQVEIAYFREPNLNQSFESWTPSPSYFNSQ